MRRVAGLLRLLPSAGLLPAPTAAQPASAVGAAFSTILCRHLHSSTSASAPIHIEDEPYCRQRQQVVLGNRVPTTAPDTWLAPDAIIIGDVDLFDKVSIWSGAVLRGDLNSIRVSAFSSIGDRTIVHAARTSPTGLSAATVIGRHVVVGQCCVLRSTTIGNEAVIGDKCILLEGSVMEDQSVLAPGSVLSPGALVESGQLWAGVPARFVRDLTKDEKADIKPLAESIFPLVDQRIDAELPLNGAFWEAESLRAKLIAASPQYANMLSGWQEVEPTPDDFA